MTLVRCNEDSASALRPYFPRNSLALPLIYVVQGGTYMKSAFGAVAGAAVVGALLVSYNLGERQAMSRAFAPMATTQMMVGPDGIARPYVVQAAQGGLGQPLVGQPYAFAPYGTATP